ncbi:MAG: oxidoreductase [Alphaproteobacteria bacterium]|nr:oxidoreductase [Alphaproteobacteria bacterium]
MVAMAVAWFAASPPRRMPPAFWPPFLFEVAALAALFMSWDVFNVYVALELASLAAVTLVAQGHGKAAVAAALRYLLVALAGAITTLLGVGLLYAGFGTLDLSILSRALAGPGLVGWLALALITVGLAAKAALFPLHTWLPAAHASAPAPGSALLSALVVEASLFVLLRVWMVGFAHAPVPGPALQSLGLIGAAGIVWGGLLAMRQRRLKLLLAFSTLTQVGYVVMVVPLSADPRWTELAWQGGGMVLVSHAFAKAAMFLGAGMIMDAAGHDRLENIRGAAHAMPMTLFAFAIGGINLVGLPPSGGFVAKWLLIEGALNSGQWWWAVPLAAGGLFTAAYLFRAVAVAFSAGDGGALAAVPRRQEVLVLMLALASLLLGLFSAQPLSVMAIGAPTHSWSAEP